MRLALPQRAWLRAVSDRYADCLRDASATRTIDVARARRQHEGYARALSRAGVEVMTLDADARAPDCCFIEDCAVAL